MKFKLQTVVWFLFFSTAASSSLPRCDEPESGKVYTIKPMPQTKFAKLATACDTGCSSYERSYEKGLQFRKQSFLTLSEVKNEYYWDIDTEKSEGQRFKVKNYDESSEKFKLYTKTDDNEGFEIVLSFDTKGRKWYGYKGSNSDNEYFSYDSGTMKLKGFQSKEEYEVGFDARESANEKTRLVVDEKNEAVFCFVEVPVKKYETDFVPWRKERTYGHPNFQENPIRNAIIKAITEKGVSKLVEDGSFLVRRKGGYVWTLYEDRVAGIYLLEKLIKMEKYKFIGAPQVVIFPLTDDISKYAFAMEYIDGVGPVYDDQDMKSNNISEKHADELGHFLSIYSEDWLTGAGLNVIFDKKRNKTFCVDTELSNFIRVPGSTNKFPWEEMHWWEKIDSDKDVKTLSFYPQSHFGDPAMWQWFKRYPLSMLQPTSGDSAMGVAIISLLFIFMLIRIIKEVLLRLRT